MSKESRNTARRLKIHWDHSDRSMHYPMIQWFIYNDNYGAVKYKDQFYNLMNPREKNILLIKLILEGIVSVQGRTIHDEFGNESIVPGYFRVLVDDYLFIHCVEERFFWINMVDRLLPQMTLEECEAYNAARKLEPNHVL